MAVRRLGATPQQYGAVGNGVTNDAPAFNNLFANEQRVLIPPAKYRLTATLDILGFGKHIYVTMARGAVLFFDGLGSGVPCVRYGPSASGQIGPDSEAVNTPSWSTWWGGRIERSNNNGPVLEFKTVWFTYTVDMEYKGGNGYCSYRGGGPRSDLAFRDWVGEAGPVMCYGFGGAPTFGVELGRAPFAGGPAPHIGETNRPASVFNRMIGSGVANSRGLSNANGSTCMNVWDSFADFTNAYFRESKAGGSVVYGGAASGHTRFNNGNETDPIDGSAQPVLSTVIGRNAQADVTDGAFTFLGPNGVTSVDL